MGKQKILPGDLVYWENSEPRMGRMRFRGIVLPSPSGRMARGWTVGRREALVFVTSIEVVKPPGWWGGNGIPDTPCLVPRIEELKVDDGSRMPGRRLWWLGKKQRTKKERKGI